MGLVEAERAQAAEARDPVEVVTDLVARGTEVAGSAVVGSAAEDLAAVVSSSRCT